MTVRLYTTVYDPDDLPTEVAHIASKSLGTVNAWTELEYQHVRKGTGSFKGKINRHHSQASLLVGGRYVIVHSDAGPIGGAWLEEAPIDLSAEQGKGDEWAGWEGRGAIAILERGRLLHTHYSTDPAASPFRGNVDNEGVWEWINAVAANIYYGGVLARSVEEGQDEPGNPLAVVTMWGTDGADRRVNDASGTPWTGLAEAFRTDIGNHVLDLAARFSQFGVITQMSYLFRLDAYNEANFGTDRSGAFGAATVRLEKGVNIAASIQRKVRGEVARTHLLVGGADYTYVTVVHPDYVAGEPAHWGFLSVPETSDPTDLAAIGLDHLRARDSQTDAWVLPLHHHGDDPENGIYEPAPDIADGHFWVGDEISFHTGSGEYDANEQSAPVAAITWQLKTGDEANGDYRVIVEVGSTFHWQDSESFSGGAPGSQNRLIFCQAGKACEDLGAGDLTAGTATNGDGESGVSTQWSGGTVQTSQRHSGTNSIGFASTADGTVVYTFDPSQVFTGGVRYVLDVWSRRNGSHISSDLAFGVAGGDEEAVTGLVEGDFLATENGADGDQWGLFRICWTPNEDRTGVRFSFRDRQSSATYFGVDDLALYTADAGDETTGTSVRAARCDHNHRHNNLLGRNQPDAHTAAAVSETTDGDVQTAIDNLRSLVGDFVEKADGGNEDANVEASTGSTETIDLSTGNHQDFTLDDDCTFTMPTAGRGKSFTAFIREGGSGGHTPTFTGVSWPGGVTPTWDTTAGAINLVAFVSDDATWYGAVVGSGGSVGALDDLSDVAITSPVSGQRLRYTGSEWVNSSLKWTPVTTYDGTNWLPAVDGSGNAIMTEA